MKKKLNKLLKILLFGVSLYLILGLLIGTYSHIKHAREDIRVTTDKSDYIEIKNKDGTITMKPKSVD